MLGTPKAEGYCQGNNAPDATMANQQERLAFVAGLITGEGWFGLTCQKSVKQLKTKNGFTIYPRFCLQMNDMETMESVAGLFNELGLSYHVSHTKGGMRIEAVGMKRVKRIASTFSPYLQGNKKAAARIILEYIALRESKPQNAPYGDEEFRLVNLLRNVVNAGNGKRQVSSETIRRAPVEEANRVKI